MNAIWTDDDPPTRGAIPMRPMLYLAAVLLLVAVPAHAQLGLPPVKPPTVAGNIRANADGGFDCTANGRDWLGADVWAVWAVVETPGGAVQVLPLDGPGRWRGTFVPVPPVGGGGFRVHFLTADRDGMFGISAPLAVP